MNIIKNINYFFRVGWVAFTSHDIDEMYERIQKVLMSDKEIQARRPIHTHFLYERITGNGDNRARIYKKCTDPKCFKNGINNEALVVFANLTPVAEGVLAVNEKSTEI